jgi:hypothetical protein
LFPSSDRVNLSTYDHSPLPLTSVLGIKLNKQTPFGASAKLFRIMMHEAALSLPHCLLIKPFSKSVIKHDRLVSSKLITVSAGFGSSEGKCDFFAQIPVP